jgi:hypothetical protein
MLTALLLASQRIPLEIDQMDRLSVNGTISTNVTGEQRIVPLRLSPSRHHSISFIGRSNLSHPILSVGPVDNIPAVTDDLSHGHPFLSISQSSHLTAVSDSVSVIRNGTSSEIFMELGLSSESFQQQYCASSIQLSNSSQVVLSSSFGSSEFAGVMMTFNHDRPGSMIYLPRFLGERIDTVLLNNGARELGMSRVFSNCVLPTLDGLPDIHIQIGNDTLLLAPDDYIGIIEGSQACFAKFSMLQDYPPARFLGINPLVIKGINTRISADSVTICDTSL